MIRYATLSLLIQLLASGVALDESQAASMHSTSVLMNEARTLDDIYQGSVLWLHAKDESGGDLFASAVMLNQRFGLTNAHNFHLFGETFTDHVVGNGSNIDNDPGEIRTIVDYGIHPTWDGVSSSFDGQADLAWFEVNQPLASPTLEINSLSINDAVRFVGFGTPATPNLGLLPIDGERKAFDGNVDAFGFAALSVSSIYARHRFLPSSGRLFGVATPGNSGSPGFNDDGGLVSLIAGHSNTPNYFSSTFALRLGLFGDWITENTAIPEPSTFALSLFAMSCLIWRRKSLR